MLLCLEFQSPSRY